ncbi:cellulose synthase operon protein YhjQ/BcsQ [Novosphingobium sp. P6W]|uniref:cellulose synthase operon protein YhjQ/BcsQ n=1 Tax=Novosphingobium sp. P6W TaxID=1609758 RepID=UPI0005C3223B|nr:cellulose synthase operon protein YhjQ/BcsQ [Novosphingobium sp. P6W]AXB75305.1 ATPase [Novosphingobium sp. P6W]KIS32644.1 ATPase [Novosphingobium sp. P6W]
MAVIVCHGLKGGAGITFVAAHLAMTLSEAGAEVTVLSVAQRDTLPLHFGLQPALTLPSLFAPAEDAVLASGINLRSHTRATDDADFVPTLHDLGYLEAGPDRVMVIDVPASEFAFARRIIPHSSANLCVLNAAPDTLALLPQVLGDASAETIARTTFAINALDETRRLSRHSAAFIRELVGPRLIGRIRLDEAVPEAIAMLQPLARYAPSSAALADVRAIGAAMVPALETPGRPWVARGDLAAPSSSRAA